MGLIGSILDLGFPAYCVDCGGTVENSEFQHICPACAVRVKTIEDPRCLTCGYPFFGETESRPDCPHCEGLDPAFERGWSIALFRGAVRELIYALKYKQGFWALQDIGELALRDPDLRRYVEGAALVPVPLHARKLRERGYNQSALIAREMAIRIGHCEVREVLSRVIDTPSQTQFNRRERRRNLKNAFAMRPGSAIDPLRPHIVVDDVFTTGSTLNACSAALRRSGVGTVRVLTVGHG